MPIADYYNPPLTFSQLWQLKVSPEIARWPLGAKIGPGCNPYPGQNCPVAFGSLVPLFPTNSLQFFRTFKLLPQCLCAWFLLHQECSPPFSLEGSFFSFRFQLSDKRSMTLPYQSLALKSVCFFHRTEHNLIFFVWLFPLFDYESLKNGMFYSSLFPLQLSEPLIYA